MNFNVCSLNVCRSLRTSRATTIEQGCPTGIRAFVGRCTEKLNSQKVPVGLEPQHPKKGLKVYQRKRCLLLCMICNYSITDPDKCIESCTKYIICLLIAYQVILVAEEISEKI